MRQISFSLILLIMIIACNNAGTPKIKNPQAKDTSENKPGRKVLIDELKRIHQIIASNDKETIANLFPFPLPDTAFSIYVDDTTYYEQLKTNNDRVTKAMFLQYFKEIAASIWLEQVNNLFKKIYVDKLLFKDTLEADAYKRSEPCFYSYRIQVDKDHVTLRMDMNSNQNYQSSKSPEDDIPENSSEFCEHNFWWVFSFDGNKLHLITISGAD